MSRGPFGLEVHPYYDSKTILDEIKLAEAMGYDDVWIGDSQLIWRELYVLMGAAAQTTSKVFLGSGVTNPITRLPAVTASAAVTLQELSGDRMMLGIGSGFSSVNTMGMKPATLKNLEEFVSDVKALCRGETIRRKTTEMNLAFGATEKCPPIYIAASGPKMLALAGRVGDGVIIARASIKSNMLTDMLDCVNAGRKFREKEEPDFKTFLSLPVCVDTDKRKAIEAVRPHVARSILTPLWELSKLAAETLKNLEQQYNNYEHLHPTANHADIIPDEVVPEYAIAGTPADCKDEVVRLLEGNIDQITIRPYSPKGVPRSVMIQKFAEEVIAPLRK